MENSTALADIQAVLSSVEAGDGRDAGTQAGYQFLALVVSVAVAVVGGALTGESSCYVTGRLDS